MKPFSPRTHIAPSPTIGINSIALKKKAAGERVYNLSAGEPIIETPHEILEAGAEAMNSGKTHYAPGLGIGELRHAAAEWMNGVHGSQYTAQNTIFTAGGKHGLSMLIDSIVSPGDEVIILAPYWVSYVSQVEMAGGVPVIVRSTEDENWKATRENIAKKISDKTVLLILNSGGNPTGALYTREELQSFLTLAEQHDLRIISDEVYSGLVYDQYQFISMSSLEDSEHRVIVVESMSKHFAMTGWRVGYVFASPDSIQILGTLQGQTTSGASTISQWAALAGIANADQIVPNIRKEMEARRNTFLHTFEESFGAALLPSPSGLYQFVPLSALGTHETDSVAFCERALQEAHIALVPGRAFGVDGYVRVSFGAAKEEVIEAVVALRAYLEK